MRIEIRMVGDTPLVCHNPRLADPRDEIKKAIATHTDKGKKQTEEDRNEVERLEFVGGLYVGREGPVIPTANIRRCLNEAAKVRNLGRDVNRSLLPAVLTVPILYDGPRDPEKLWAEPRFRYLTSIGVSRRRVMRMRPQFPEWEIVSEWELTTDVMDVEKLAQIATAAGLIEGLGDNRINGYGRFTAIVKELG